jgi:hypothetical protein
MPCQGGRCLARGPGALNIVPRRFTEAIAATTAACTTRNNRMAAFHGNSGLAGARLPSGFMPCALFLLPPLLLLLGAGPGASLCAEAALAAAAALPAALAAAKGRAVNACEGERRGRAARALWGSAALRALVLGAAAVGGGAQVEVSTHAGFGSALYPGFADGTSEAAFDSPHGVAADTSGNVFVADTQNHAVSAK